MGSYTGVFPSCLKLGSFQICPKPGHMSNTKVSMQSLVLALLQEGFRCSCTGTVALREGLRWLLLPLHEERSFWTLNFDSSGGLWNAVGKGRIWNPVIEEL